MIIRWLHPLSAVLVNKSPSTTLTAGTPYSYTFTATGTPSPTFSTFSGSLPTGLTLNASTGVLSGTPTTGGSFTFVVRATNSGGSDDSAPITVAVAAAPSLVNESPPASGTPGTAYSYTFTATGSPSPTFSTFSGSLPTGLTLNASTGVLSGTPTAVGSFTFVVRATNAAGTGDSASIVVVVANAAPAPAPAPAPASEPSTSASPTPTPTASAAIAPAATALGPVTNAANSGVPAGGVAAGTGVLIVNGEKVSVTVKPDAKDEKLLEVSGPGFTMSLAGLNAQGQPLGLTPDGALILEQDRTAAVAGTGFQPNSLVYLYLFSEPRFLGTVQTDAIGGFKGSVPLPADIADGRHTLQSNGFTPDGTVRSLSLGVVLATPVVATSKRATAKVYFESLSSVLTEEGMTTLKTLVKKTGKKGVRTVSIGYVQGTTITSNDEALSTQRAKNVAAYLKKLGLKGRFVVRGDGIAKESGPTARRVNISVSYLK